MQVLPIEQNTEFVHVACGCSNVVVHHPVKVRFLATWEFSVCCSACNVDCTKEISLKSSVNRDTRADDLSVL